MSSTFQQDLERLQAAGATYEAFQTSKSSSINLGGIDINTGYSSGMRYEWQLPADTGIQAAFSQEKIGKKLLKIFTKELQTGDQTFDDAVYISTKSSEKTTALLADQNVRDIIFGVAAVGGTISVEGQRLVYAMVEDERPLTEQQAGMITFIDTILNQGH